MNSIVPYEQSPMSCVVLSMDGTLRTMFLALCSIAIYQKI